MFPSHPRYDYSMIDRRPVYDWPGGKRLAFYIGTNVEYFAFGAGAGSDPAFGAGGRQTQRNYAWRDYGHRVGIWRLYDLFDELGVQASCTTNAVTFERRRPMVQAVLDRGWELLAHNWEQGELLSDYAGDPAKEREIVLRTLAKYESEVGRKALGWLSSSLRGTLQTADILAEQGAIFYCDIMNDDQPYLLKTPSGPIVSIPYSNEINDFTLLTRRNYTTDQFRDILIEELDVLYAEGAKTGRIMNVGLHPHVSGRAHRVRALREFIEHAKSLPGVWWATREEIARWYLANHESHIPNQLGDRA